MAGKPRFEDGVSSYLDLTGKYRVGRPAPLCDFCLTPASERPLTWSYPCGYVRIIGNPVMDASDDEWLACDPCHDAIEADDMELLIVRNVAGLRHYADWHDPRLDIVKTLRMLRENLERFKRARRGPPVPRVTT